MRTRNVQTDFLSGVLDPRALGRTDTDAYNRGLLVGSNVTVHHLGGVFRRPGFKFIQRLRNTLQFVTPSSATAPEGGTAANGYDQDEATLVTTTNNVSTTDPYVVVRYDLGSAVSVAVADVKGIVSTSGNSAEFAIQYSTDDVSWTTLGDPLPDVSTLAHTYRRSANSATLGPTTVSARYWRVAKIGGTDMSTATISLNEFNLWTETSTISNVRLFSLELNTETRYVVAVTDRSATLYQNGAIVDNGWLPLPYVSADIPDLDAAVGADALFMVHEDYAPRTIVDEFTGEDFQSDPVTFESIPQYDYADSSSPTPTSEIQVVTFNANWVQGDTFQIELDGARTALISYGGDATANEQATTAANIAREVQKLYTVPGFTGVTCARTGALAYTVTFADASAKTYDGLMNVTPGTVVTSTAAATSARTQAGVPRTEDVWSATRGYPRTVTFFEGRLYFGGTRSRLQSLFGSAVNDPLTFELGEQLDADPLFVTLNGQQLNAINAIFSGRSLELMTSGGEFRYVNREGDPITPGKQPTAQTKYGAKKVHPVSVDGATLFVQRLGKSVRDFRYDFEEDAYNSLGLSSLAPHLINNVVDMTAWQGSSTDEINLVYVINTDGTVAVLNLRREAEVRAWTRWYTGSSAVEAADGTISGQDKVRAGVATVEEVYFAVQRTVDGADSLFLEQTDDDMYVDSGANVVSGSTDNVWWLDGETCRVRLQSSHIVLTDQLGGTVTVSEVDYAGANIQAGLNFNPTVTPMPLNSLTPEGSNVFEKRRVVKAIAKVRNTLGLRVNGRPLPDRYFDIDTLDADPTPYTGNHDLEETTNWDRNVDKTVTFDQIDPLPMEILSIAVNMESA